MEQTPNKSQHTKLTLEKNILSPLLPGFELTNLSITSPSLDRQASPAWSTRVRRPNNNTRGLLLHPDNASAHAAAATLDYLEANRV